MFWVLAPPFFVGLALSFCIEHLLQPAVQPFWRRPLAAFALHLGLWMLLFAAELALVQRPWFGIANILALLLLVVLVSNAKFCSLREPFIYQDFEYFLDALKHPRLYLPFFGLGKALLAAIGYGLVLFTGLTFESSLTGAVPTIDFLTMMAALVFLGIALLWFGARKKLPVVFEPETDLQNLGLLTSLWRYGEEEYQRCCIASHSDFAKPAQETSGVFPHLVVVQSESFCDIRKIFAGIRPEILKEIDLLRGSAVCHGKLAVPAWGANTVRTEFAFLSGLKSSELGVHKFNPYRKVARQGVPTLPSFLKDLGYRTVCVHPYPAGFYSRNKVFPLLGFDEFIDIGSFEGVEKTGPYVGDVALAEKVGDLLGETSSQPIFVFVITMENHGPLHLEEVQEGDDEKIYSSPPASDCVDLTIYLRHLRNADRMAGLLRKYLEAMPGSGWLCWFGDHVPIMPNVYKAMGMPDGRTDYIIWGKNELLCDGNPSDRAVENLGGLLLEKMGLMGKRAKDAAECVPPQVSS